jgi:hypothetical protein
MLSIMLRKKDRKTELDRALEDQKKRVSRSYKEMEQAEHDFTHASASYVDIAIRRWEMAQKRCGLEIELYKQLEREYFHERIAK